jgi:hypothetical protein
MSVDIINDALKYYDENNEKYKKLKKKMKYMKVAPGEQKDIEGIKLVFYDENKEELFTSRVEVFGKYYYSAETWIWGWSIPYLHKALTGTSRKIWLYGTDIDISNDANILLKNELLTSRFRIDDKIQLEIHAAISSYLAKKPFIFRWKEFYLNPGDFNEVKGEYSKTNTDFEYYTFVLDPPDLDKLKL